MSKYLNSFIITDDIIKKMEEILKESRTKEIELGFSLCKRYDNNILKIGEHCVGGECSIALPERCEEKDDIYMGAYHTHFNDPKYPHYSTYQTIFGNWNNSLDLVGLLDKRDFSRYTDEELLESLRRFEREEGSLLQR